MALETLEFKDSDQERERKTFSYFDTSGEEPVFLFECNATGVEEANEKFEERFGLTFRNNPNILIANPEETE